MAYWLRTCGAATEQSRDVIEALIKALHNDDIHTLDHFHISFPGGSALWARR
jgi:hypothetical protein